jgi:hypothetical protein
MFKLGEEFTYEFMRKQFKRLILIILIKLWFGMKSWYNGET